MDEKKTKEILDFLLSAYRARLAIQDTTDGCPFDFTSYLAAWKRSSKDWGQLQIEMRENLEPLLQEGLFDSILPYLTSSFDLQQQQKLQATNSNGKYDPYSPRHGQSSNILGSIGDLNLGKIKEKKKSRDKQKDTEDAEIVIHVCDESKGVREDFYCQQSILTKEMGYFTRVTVKGQRLRDMDISVHCDISVFDWLMKWVHHCSTPLAPKLDPPSVIGLVVSADFLQMTSLVTECLQYTYENLENVITTSPNLGCLSEQLTARLAGYFHNIEIERRIVPTDKNDRITSRLYIQLILSLNDPEPDMSRGHYASTASLFRCDLCEQTMTNDYANKLACTAMRFDCRGRIYANHFKDSNWSLATYIKELKRELKTWRKVYWRLWGTVHFFYCSSCHMYFPAKNLGGCRYHPELPKLLPESIKYGGKEGVAAVVADTTTSSSASSTEPTYMRRHCEEMRRGGGGGGLGGMKVIQEEPEIDAVTYLPYGSYPCCRQPAYIYTPLPHINGCQMRDHVIDNCALDDPNKRTMLEFREIIQNPSPSMTKLDWGGIIQMTTEKPSMTPSAFLDGAKETMVARLSRELSSSDSESDNDDSDSEPNAGSSPLLRKSNNGPLNENSAARLWESWLWNNDLTTRYNQDMQREREERLMIDLSCILSQRVYILPLSVSQRVPLDPSVGFHAAKYGFLSRRMLKENIGGSYVKLDQIWREQYQLAITRHHQGAHNKNKGQKTAKPE